MNIGFIKGDLIHYLPKNKRTKKASPLTIIKYYSVSGMKNGNQTETKMVEVRVMEYTSKYLTVNSIKHYYKW